MRTEKETLVLKIRAFGMQNHPSFMKGTMALKCICGCDVYGSVYYPSAFKLVIELLNELKSGVLVDSQLLYTINKWLRLPETHNE